MPPAMAPLPAGGLGRRRTVGGVRRTLTGAAGRGRGVCLFVCGACSWGSLVVCLLFFMW